MKIINEPLFNYNLGVLEYLYPSDGEKFVKVTKLLCIL
ncbi:hypothetical protein AN393_00021 [Pseudoalteromonas sp. P1-25]|nr:hypothetical protein AN389_03847 [Pseudoalteromonas sp. P1-7a]KPZ58213.1 hypothetical protein AN393_00021 [Pseudoalteromonas sp. P1-25]